MKYKRIVSFGDSFTWGTDLADCTQKPLTGFSHYTWPALLAKHLGISYECRALGGASNSNIVRRLIKRIPALKQTDLIILNWTYIDRWEYHNGTTDLWESLRPSGTESNEFHKYFYKYVHSQYWNLYESLKHIMFAHELLRNRGVNYLSTAMDKLLVERPFEDKPENLETSVLVDQVEPSLFWFDGLDFLSWSIENHFTLGATGHPIEEAHQAAFEYIRDNYDFTK
jgi:hypothetical protein